MYALSPLRYPGAKWRLAPFVESVIQRNRIHAAHYAEPYAGGASLALSLLLKGAVSEIHLNDLDRSVYAFWKSVTEHSEELLERIKTIDVSMESWYAQKLVQANKGRASIVDLGFSTFFLNRTNRSGILSAGVVGGKDQSGAWKLDARFNKSNLIERVARIVEYRSRIHVTKLDALEFISRRSSTLPSNSLMFLDPPYFVKGQELYLNAYGPGDHQQVASAVMANTRVNWLVTYDDVPEIRMLYRGTRRERYKLRYSASSTRIGGEVLFLSKGLRADISLLNQA